MYKNEDKLKEKLLGNNDGMTIIDINNNNDASKEVQTLAPLTYSAAVKHMLKTAGPFTLSNLSLAIYTIGNGIVLQQIGDDAVASGPLMATFAYSIFSTVNGILYATGILIGDLNGLTSTDPNKAKEIGSLMRRSWVIGAGLAIPSLMVILNSGAMLKASGIEAAVAQEVQDYFTGISYGLVPIFLNFADQQLTLGLNHQKVTLISGTAYSAMAALFGYPLALGAFGLPKLGTAGMGYGATLSGIISLIGLRTYFAKNPDYAQYALYNWTRFADRAELKRYFTKDLMDFLRVGFPIGLQNLSEWGNLAILSMLAGQLGNDVLEATQVSIIPISAFGVLILALSQATGVSVAECLGAGKALLLKGERASYQVALKNSKTLGYAGLGIGSGVTLLIGSLFIGIPRQISSLFLNTDSSDSAAEEEILDMAETMLLINGIGLLIDTIRNVAGGGLRGYQDVNFVPIISFITMSVLGLSLGGTLAVGFDMGADTLFITRNIGMFIAAAAILYRFYAFDPANEVAEISASSSSNTTIASSPTSPKMAVIKKKSNPFTFFPCCTDSDDDDENKYGSGFDNENINNNSI